MITNKNTILYCGLHVADGIWLEVSETLHYWTTATGAWGIGILLGVCVTNMPLRMRPHVHANVIGGRFQYALI